MKVAKTVIPTAAAPAPEAGTTAPEAKPVAPAPAAPPPAQGGTPAPADDLVDVDPMDAAVLAAIEAAKPGESVPFSEAQIAHALESLEAHADEE